MEPFSTVDAVVGAVSIHSSFQAQEGSVPVAAVTVVDSILEGSFAAAASATSQDGLSIQALTFSVFKNIWKSRHLISHNQFKEVYSTQFDATQLHSCPSKRVRHIDQ